MLNSSFSISYGDSDNPGVAIIGSSGLSFTSEDEGIYTCSLPDETEVNIQRIYVGIFLIGFSSKLPSNAMFKLYIIQFRLIPLMELLFSFSNTHCNISGARWHHAHM